MTGHAAGSVVVDWSIIPGGTETVLVVEDDAAVRRLIQSFLGGRGYSVLGAATAAEAIEVCESSGPIDLLLVDLNLPDMSGQELADRLRGRHEGMKLLYMSGQGERAVELGILPHGRLFLPKPFTPYELAWRVREVLDAAAT